MVLKLKDGYHNKAVAEAVAKRTVNTVSQREFGDL